MPAQILAGLWGTAWIPGTGLSICHDIVFRRRVDSGSIGKANYIFSAIAIEKSNLAKGRSRVNQSTSLEIGSCNEVRVVLVDDEPLVR